MEICREYIRECLTDYSKAFDCVEHDNLWTALEELGIPLHLIMLIRSLFIDQEATVYITYGNTEWFKIGKGVRQGCILSPLLFNLYKETITRKLDLDESIIRVKIGGWNISNLRYADDPPCSRKASRIWKIWSSEWRRKANVWACIWMSRKWRSWQQSTLRSTVRKSRQRLDLPSINYWAGQRMHIWNQAEDCTGSWRNGEHDQDLEKQRS